MKRRGSVFVAALAGVLLAGGVEKGPVAATPPPEKKRGLRGKIVENKNSGYRKLGS